MSFGGVFAEHFRCGRASRMPKYLKKATKTILTSDTGTEWIFALFCLHMLVDSFRRLYWVFVNMDLSQFREHKEFAVVEVEPLSIKLYHASALNIRECTWGFTPFRRQRLPFHLICFQHPPWVWREFSTLSTKCHFTKSLEFIRPEEILVIDLMGNHDNLLQTLSSVPFPQRKQSFLEKVESEVAS